MPLALLSIPAANMIVFVEHANKAPKVTSEEKKPATPDEVKIENGHAPAKADTHHHSLHRPLLSHSVSAKDDPSTPNLKLSRDSKSGQSGRRNSWMTSISSKFSSSNSNTGSSGPEPELSNGVKAPKGPKNEHSTPFSTPSSAKDIKKPEATAPSPPASPKNPGFLSSALRRLSSTGNTGLGKATGLGPACHRKTMNVDPYRERCAVPELDHNKLRRVAFCVDVEIAGSAQYVDDVEQPGAIGIDDEPSLSRIERELAEKKKNKKLSQIEGEALKRPNTVAEEKETTGAVSATGEVLKDPQTTCEPELPQEPSKKKEKKKRSESERKERKEKKHQQALANGSLPIEITRDDSADSSNSGGTPSTSQDRPTTDPLRIYRRCCQLRETPILKRISEQISSPAACPIATPGILSVLDLTGYWMQLPDVITLGDYLAVVPVKKLILDNCGLGDEAVRVLLAGLLAAKTPDQARYNKKLVKKYHMKPEADAVEQLGVVEKVSLKNNPKIGKDGWRHIALFIYMSRSLKAIDLSMIPFPEYSARSSSVKSHHTPHPHGHDPQPPPQMDMPSVISEAIAGRLGGDHLEELVMAECNLDSDAIGQIVDSVIKCGITRLGLASNNLSREGLQHVIRFLQCGKCDGLDIGGNTLQEHIPMLSEAFASDNGLWALSLADCGLLPSSLETLLPILAKLPNLRFVDLSHNRELFSTKPSALRSIRKYLPLFQLLKRIHLMDVAMTPEHVIALAETLPECPSLCHLNILENHLLQPLASAKTEEAQEEACAMYASLMAAVRVSDTLICIDIDVPTEDSGEIVKALARQVVAYSLRNLERLPLENVLQDSAITSMTQAHGAEPKEMTVPDVLMGLVGHVEGFPENHDQDPPAPDDDYIVGGTGVVKALDICLNRAERMRDENAPSPGGAGTPNRALQEGQFTKGKAKEMSKNLLDSARKIRGRLQPALIKEAKAGDANSYRKSCFSNPHSLTLLTAIYNRTSSIP